MCNLTIIDTSKTVYRVNNTLDWTILSEELRAEDSFPMQREPVKKTAMPLPSS